MDPVEVQQNDWFQILCTKANKEEVIRMGEIKVNKTDFENLSNAIDVMHR